MKVILSKVMSVLGWKKVLAYVWEIAYEDLKQITDKTPAKWDDKTVEVLNELVKELTDEKLAE